MELEKMIPKDKSTLKKVLNSYKVRQITLWTLDMFGILIAMLSGYLKDIVSIYK